MKRADDSIHKKSSSNSPFHLLTYSLPFFTSSNRTISFNSFYYLFVGKMTKTETAIKIARSLYHTLYVSKANPLNLIYTQNSEPIRLLRMFYS